MQKNQRKGFILLLVIAMIPLIGMVLAIIITNNHLLVIQTRREELRLNAENACQSGLLWLEHNRNRQIFLEKKVPVLLIIQDGTKHVSCQVEPIQETPDGENIRIIGRAEDSRFSIECKEKTRL